MDYLAQTVYFYYYCFYIEYSNYNSNALWSLQQHVSTNEYHIQVYRDVMRFSLFVHRTDMVLMCLHSRNVCVWKVKTQFTYQNVASGCVDCRIVCREMLIEF